MATKKTTSTKSTKTTSAAKAPKKKAPTKRATRPKKVEVEVEEEDLDLGDRLDEVLSKVKENDYGINMAEAIDVGSRAATAYRLGEEVAEDPVQLLGVLAGIAFAGYKVWKEMRK